VSLKYKDAAGAETAWAAANYISDTDSMPGRLVLAYGASWPSASLYPVHPIRIRYTAGIATASPQAEAAADVRNVIMLLAAALWEHREPEPEPEKIGALLRRKYGLETILENLVVHGG
jgi:hypothetical protein